MSYNLREIRRIIYNLKRQYGLILSYYRPLSTEYDLDTGESTRTFDLHIVKRAVLLPTKLDRSFVYDLTYIAANNNFVGGALFDRDQRVILIDGRDLPIEPNLDDHVEFEGQRYQIAEINTTAGYRAHLLRVQGLTNSGAVNE